MDRMKPDQRLYGNWTNDMRSQVLRPATLNDVEGTQGNKPIVWVNDKPYVLKSMTHQPS